MIVGDDYQGQSYETSSREPRNHRSGPQQLRRSQKPGLDEPTTKLSPCDIPGTGHGSRSVEKTKFAIALILQASNIDSGRGCFLGPFQGVCPGDTQMARKE